ncbi:hypothetical protein A0W34_29990 (plasmid) [Rhodococcus sp. BH4]|uniref:AMP-binding protein n=1 Tax=Rhodococcus sp. BH4 TaxID=1807790 RepID=UPI0009C2AC02|nr:AMP-binding protein [Rhodococcus sp. BH4]ARE37758.1 hypothetical protein A0W34_29990 [Rhodococcus sp. BH4]
MGDELIDGSLRRAAATAPETIAFHDRLGDVTFAELDRQVGQLSTWLLGAGVGPGDVVSWQLPNWSIAASVHFAVARVGVVSNPITPISIEDLLYRHHGVADVARVGSR